MATDTKLPAERRVKLGTAASRRLRRAGIIPGNVYGHRQDAVPVAVREEVLERLMHSGARVIDLELEGSVEKAMFRDVQWDTFGVKIQHIDLLRVDPNERVTVDIGIELRGIAPGTMAGGVLEQPLHTLSVECLAYHIPDAIVVRIGKLEIGESIHVRDLELGAGVVVHNPPEAVVVQVSEPVETAEEEEVISVEGVQPEVIGRKTEESEES